MQAPTTQAATPSMPRQIAGTHSGSRPPAATSLSSTRRRRLYLLRPPRYPARQPRLSPDATFRATRRRTTLAATVGCLSSPSLALSAPALPFGSPTNASRRSHLLLLDDPPPPLLMDRRHRDAAAQVPRRRRQVSGFPACSPPPRLWPKRPFRGRRSTLHHGEHLWARRSSRACPSSLLMFQ